MTEQQLFALHVPLVTMPQDAFERVRARVLAEVRRQRIRRQVWRVVVLVVVSVWLATLTVHASPVPHSMSAIVIDATGQRMANVTVDIRVASPAGGTAMLTTTDSDGEVWFAASPGDTVTVRAGSDCHMARRDVGGDNEPMLVAPSCGVWLPVVHTSNVEGQEVAQ